MINNNNTCKTIIYSEAFCPWFVPLTFFLPCFYKYGILIEKDETNQNNHDDQSSSRSSTDTITFGYGFSGPAKRFLTSHTTYLNDIVHSSIITGNASWRDNLLQFGGWGIKYGFGNGTWAYNATFSGPYCEFVENIGSKSTKYRIVTNNPETVAAILQGESSEKLID